MEKIDIITAPIRFPPAGLCIYCGTTDAKLTDEHIVPFGLAGHALVLPKSSCEACATVTGKIENEVLGKQFRELRTALKIPSRRKRPTGFDLRLSFSKDGENFGDASSQIDAIPPDEFPWRCFGLMMDKAGFLLGVPRFQPLEWSFWSIGKNAPKVPMQGFKAVAIQTGQINPYVFAQFLAKVAHSYACAYFGLKAFEPMLLDLIYGKTDGGFRHWVGGDLAVQPPMPGKLHHVSATRIERGGSVFLIVHIHLFRMLGTPAYHVVVGRLRTNVSHAS